MSCTRYLRGRGFAMSLSTETRRFIKFTQLFLVLFSNVKADKVLPDSTIERLITENRYYINLFPTGVRDYRTILPLIKNFSEIKNIRLKADAAYILGHYYMHVSDAENALRYFTESGELYKKGNEWGKYLNVTKDFCNLSRRTGNFDIIEPTLKMCLEIPRKHDVGFYILDPLHELSVHLGFVAGDYRGCVKYGLMFIDTLAKYQKMNIKNPDFEYSATYDLKLLEIELGHSYIALGDFKKAESYLYVAERYFKARKEDERLSRIYRYLAMLAGYQNKQDAVVKYLDKFNQYQVAHGLAERKAFFNLPGLTRELYSLNEAFKQSREEVEHLTRQNYYSMAAFVLALALGFFVLRTQIREKKNQTKINELLRRDFERSQKLSEEKTKYFSILSHELRTPIFAITGLAKLLQDPVNNTNENVEAIINSGNHLLHLVNNVLQHNKLEESTQITLDEVDFELTQTFQELLQTTSYLAGQKSIQIQFRNGLMGQEYLFGDKQKLSQILVNLISNAIRYSRRNGKVEVSVSEKSSGDLIRTFRFTIRDFGVGIEPSQVPFLFDYRKTTYDGPSEDLDNLKGMGIGLFVVANFITAMGSEIMVESEPGAGATFYFDLSFKAGKPVLMPDSSLLRTNKDVNILVVDDIRINLIVTQKTLSTIGIKCFTATDADPVVEFIERENIDLVLMDLNMPLINGYDLSRKIRRAGITIPIIAHTAVIKENIDYQALEDAEIHDFLIKPYPIEDMKEKLTKYLNIGF